MAEQVPKVLAVNDEVEDAQVVVQPMRNQACMAMNPAMNPLVDITSPFYLHAGENLGLVLVSTQLMETNYYVWSKAMSITFHSKDKIGFIDDDILESPEL